MIIVDKLKEIKRIKNKYTIKQYVILMCDRTYRLNRWDIVLDVIII